MHTACFKGNKEIVQILIVAGANTESKNIHGATPLITATFYGKKDISEYLRTTGSNIDIASKEGKELAQTAISAGQTESFDDLLNSNVDINLKDKNGKTMLQVAIEKGDNETAIKLIKKGANVNTECVYAGGDKVSPLQTAILKQNTEMVKELLKANADLNTKSRPLGLTPLQIAILSENEEIIALLLYHGADVNSLTTNGFTSADIALAKKDTTMLKKLISNGALFGKKAGSKLVPYGCTMTYNAEKGMYQISANDAILAIVEFEKDKNPEYTKYMEKSYTYRKEQGLTLENHALKVYPLLFELMK